MLYQIWIFETSSLPKNNTFRSAFVSQRIFFLAGTSAGALQQRLYVLFPESRGKKYFSTLKMHKVERCLRAHTHRILFLLFPSVASAFSSITSRLNSVCRKDFRKARKMLHTLLAKETSAFTPETKLFKTIRRIKTKNKRVLFHFTKNAFRSWGLSTSGVCKSSGGRRYTT